jgi:lipopolysaccharide/colanic/teichoic acid biosynthesis glycosyltransferase
VFLTGYNYDFQMTQQNNTSSNWGYLLSKRIVDLVFGITLLLISAPIFLLAALVIRLDSSGNPFFVQKRIGLRGKPFWIIKLRGMYIDARERFPELYDYSGHNGLDFHFHYEEDPRVTRIGRYTRRTSIDEMPNFINVVLGDMSLVGPRPEVPDVMELYGQYAEEYLSVKPGITCLSKCSGRDTLTKEETIQLDLDYIQRRSFLLDAKVLWWTFVGVVLRRDVH